jgi:HlyD family secretion protein
MALSAPVCVPRIKSAPTIASSNLLGKVGLSLLLALSVALSSCGFLPKENADAQSGRPKSSSGAGSGPTAVDVAIAATAPIQAPREYTGTTQPQQEVVIRAQAEGQLRELNVDVGAQVVKGQTLAQIDAALLDATVKESEAELASRRSEVSQLETQISEAKTVVEQSRLQLQQAESNADRYDQLAASGAIPKQQAEQFRTAAKTAAQVLQAAQAKVRSQEQGVVAANARILAQNAVLTQQNQRRSYARLTAPVDGVVLTRSTELGNLVQVGGELLRLGDFSQVKVTVQLSELDLATVRLGTSAKVRLDAFPKEQFTGEVTQISPAANPTSRLVPIEVTIPNATGRVGSGLLARVSFVQANRDRVLVPISALQEDRSKSSAAAAKTPKAPKAPRTKGTLFVVTDQNGTARVAARSVDLGQEMDGKVQILAGLNPGDRFVARMGKPLKDGDEVRLSILSQP